MFLWSSLRKFITDGSYADLRKWTFPIVGLGFLTYGVMKPLADLGLELANSSRLLTQHKKKCERQLHLINERCAADVEAALAQKEAEIRNEKRFACMLVMTADIEELEGRLFQKQRNKVVNKKLKESSLDQDVQKITLEKLMEVFNSLSK